MARSTPGSLAGSSDAVKYTTLGRTGVTVSRLCLGCMSYGTPEWRPWILDEKAAQPFFRRAIEAGVNFFDTADMYSLGVSEEITGRALRMPDEIGALEAPYLPHAVRGFT